LILPHPLIGKDIDDNGEEDDNDDVAMVCHHHSHIHQLSPPISVNFSKSYAKLDPKHACQVNPSSVLVFIHEIKFLKLRTKDFDVVRLKGEQGNLD
jgi:hypothetical protein